MISHDQYSQRALHDTGLTPRSYRRQNISFHMFQKPEPKGFFSLGEDRTYKPSTEQLRYFKPPINFPLDLNDGYGSAIIKPDDDHEITNLLKFIKHNLQSLLIQGERPKLCAEFVSWRGLLRLIMCTPYEMRQDWCIHVSRYNNVFYLRQRSTEEDKHRRATETEQQKRFLAWGRKFEQYCLSQSPTESPTYQEPVNECNEFSCVYRTKIFDDLYILYAAEMDGIIQEKPVSIEKEPEKLRDLKFVELKTRVAAMNFNQQKTFNRFKTLNWWCQSYLVGIEDIYVGMRDDKGLVGSIEHVIVKDLVKQGMKNWTPAVCSRFLVDFLACLKRVMADVNSPHIVYEYYFNAQASKITYKCLEGQSVHSFLPDWYIDCWH